MDAPKYPTWEERAGSVGGTDSARFSLGGNIIGRVPFSLSFASKMILCSLGRLLDLSGDVLDLVHADRVVGPARVEVGAGAGPGERLASKQFLRVALISLHGVSNDVVLHELRSGEIEDLDASLGGNDEPVEALREEDAVDGGVALLLGEPLAVDDVPDHDLAVARAGSQVGGVLDDVKGGNLGGVSLEGVLQGHVHVVPNLDRLVPGGGHAQAGLLGVVKAHHRHRISVHVLLDGVLALRTGVPDLDLLVETTGDNLAIVG